MILYAEGGNGFKEGEEERNIVRLKGIGEKKEQAVRAKGEEDNEFQKGGRREGEEYCENEG